MKVLQLRNTELERAINHTHIPHIFHMQVLFHHQDILLKLQINVQQTPSSNLYIKPEPKFKKQMGLYSYGILHDILNQNYVTSHNT